MHLARKASRAAAWLRAKGVPETRRALLAGNRASGFSNELSRVTVLPLRCLPGGREPLLAGWEGVLIAGELGGEPAVVQTGRLHLYEGFLPGEVAFTVRALAALGVRSLLLVGRARALGGAGGAEATLVTDRIDFTGVPLLRGALAGPQGPVFDPRPVPEGMRTAALEAAAACGVPLAEGIAALVHGPGWPTPAEARMMRGLGADVATMELAPEIATAERLGLDFATLLISEGAGWERRHVELCLRLLERM